MEVVVRHSCDDHHRRVPVDKLNVVAACVCVWDGLVTSHKWKLSHVHSARRSRCLTNSLAKAKEPKLFVYSQKQENAHCHRWCRLQAKRPSLVVLISITLGKNVVNEKWFNKEQGVHSIIDLFRDVKRAIWYAFHHSMWRSPCVIVFYVAFLRVFYIIVRSRNCRVFV